MMQSFSTETRLSSSNTTVARQGRVALEHLTRWLRLPLGALLLTTGTLKLLAPIAFVDSIIAYNLLPTTWVSVAASSVIIAEVALGAALLLGYKTRLAALLTAVLVALFTVVQILTISRGMQIECGCLPEVKEQMVGWSSVARNLLLMLWAVSLYLLLRHRGSA